MAIEAMKAGKTAGYNNITVDTIKTANERMIKNPGDINE